MVTNTIPIKTLKVYLQNENTLAENRCYVGVICKSNDTLRFEEEAKKLSKPHTRNPKIKDMKHTSLVRRPDNTLKFSFKELKPDFNPDTYPFEVFDEIRTTLSELK